MRVGAMGRNAPARLQYAGTYDDRWLSITPGASHGEQHR